MNILEKRIKIRKLHKISLFLLLVSAIGAIATGGNYWMLPVILLFFSSSMCNADTGHLNKQITKNRGTAAEEHY